VPYHVDWLIENQIIYLYSWGIVTAEDFEAFSGKIVSLQADADGMVHTFVNSLNVDKVEAGIGDLKTIFGAMKPNRKHGWTVSVSDSRLIRFFATLVSQFSNSRERHYETLEEAAEFLAESDDRLPSAKEILDHIHTVNKSIS